MTDFQPSSSLLLLPRPQTASRWPYPTTESQTKGAMSLANLKRFFAASRSPRPAATPRKLSESSNSTSAASYASSATYVEDHDAQDEKPLLPPSQRTLGIWDAGETIRAFVREHWSSHADIIRVDCDITLAELHALGSLPQIEGPRACGRLVRVPAIHEEVAFSLWEHLVTETRKLPVTPEVGQPDGEQPGLQLPPTADGIEITPKRKDLKRNLSSFFSQRRRSKPQADALTRTPSPSPRCPFCTHSCNALQQPHPSKTQAQHERDSNDAENNFWQREEPPAPPPRTRKPSASESTTSTLVADSTDELHTTIAERSEKDEPTSLLKRWTKKRLGLPSSRPRSQPQPQPDTPSSLPSGPQSGCCRVSQQ